jgi:hypothetical protein
MLPLEESRAVTTASMRSPGMPAGRAIVIALAFETRSVVLPSWTIPSPDGREGAVCLTKRCAERAQAFLKVVLRTLCRSAAAEGAFAPASKAAPMSMMHPPAAIERGRLPNMDAQSAHPVQPITPLTRRGYLVGVHSLAPRRLGSRSSSAQVSSKATRGVLERLTPICTGSTTIRPCSLDSSQMRTHVCPDLLSSR